MEMQPLCLPSLLLGPAPLLVFGSRSRLVQILAFGWFYYKPCVGFSL